MNLGVGARSFGLGMSGVSYLTDVTSGYWNPAGLNSLNDKYQLGLMHSSYFGGIANYDYGAFAMKLDDVSSLGVSLIRFSIDDIPDTRFLFDPNGAINYDNVEFFSSSDYGLLFSYARKLDQLGGIDLGGNVKIIHRRVGDFANAWGFGLDIGARKDLNDWHFGLVARDIFGTYNAWNHNVEELEDVYLATGNLVPENTIEVTVPRVILAAARDFYYKDFSLLVTVELDATFDGKRNTIIKSDFASIDPHGGLELGYKNIAFLRFGASQIQQVTELNGETDWKYTPTGGLGFRIKEVAIDYAMTDVADQAEGLYSHVFSITVDFHGNEE